MRKLLTKTLIVLMIQLVVVWDLSAQPIEGTRGASSQWGAGWLDLWVPIDFKKGEKLRIVMGGTATEILLRFLPVRATPDSPIGIDGGVRKVPANRVLEVTLESDHPQTKQISVHGGSKAWDFSLGKDSGPATLVSVERINHQPRLR